MTAHIDRARAHLTECPLDLPRADDATATLRLG